MADAEIEKVLEQLRARLQEALDVLPDVTPESMVRTAVLNLYGVEGDDVEVTSAEVADYVLCGSVNIRLLQPPLYITLSLQPDLS